MISRSECRTFTLITPLCVVQDAGLEELAWVALHFGLSDLQAHQKGWTCLRHSRESSSGLSQGARQEGASTLLGFAHTGLGRRFKGLTPGLLTLV